MFPLADAANELAVGYLGAPQGRIATCVSALLGSNSAGRTCEGWAIISDIPRSQENQDLRATPFEIRNLLASNVNDSEGPSLPWLPPR